MRNLRTLVPNGPNMEETFWRYSISSITSTHDFQTFVNLLFKLLLNWLHVLIMSRTRFRVNLHSTVAWTPCSKQVRYLKFKWLQRDSNLLSLQSLKLQILCLFRVRSSLISGNYRVWIHSQTRAWHDKNIQSNALCR